MANKRFFEKFTFNTANTAYRAIGTHTIGRLPANAVITQAFFDIDTTFTSAADTATIGVGVTGSVDLFDAAVAINDGANAWDAGLRAADEPTNQDDECPGPDAIADFYPVGASSVDVIVTTAVQALTAGKFSLYVEYYID